MGIFYDIRPEVSTGLSSAATITLFFNPFQENDRLVCLFKSQTQVLLVLLGFSGCNIQHVETLHTVPLVLTWKTLYLYCSSIAQLHLGRTGGERGVEGGKKRGRGKVFDSTWVA